MTLTGALILGFSAFVMFAAATVSAARVQSGDAAVPRWVTSMMGSSPRHPVARASVLLLTAVLGLMSQLTILLILLGLSSDEDPLVSGVLVTELFMAAAWLGWLGWRWTRRPFR